MMYDNWENTPDASDKWLASMGLRQYDILFKSMEEVISILKKHGLVVTDENIFISKHNKDYTSLDFCYGKNVVKTYRIKFYNNTATIIDYNVKLVE